jgi:hypothetical protein
MKKKESKKIGQGSASQWKINQFNSDCCCLHLLNAFPTIWEIAVSVK